MNVINLYAGPGAGKSTTAAGVFFKMKTMNMKVELVTEYAKDLVYEERYSVFRDQEYLFAQQHRRLKRLLGKVDWVVTDSPLMLVVVYAKDAWEDEDISSHFSRFVKAVDSRYNNFNFFIERVKPYQPYGRLQDEYGAIKKDMEIKDMLSKEGIPYSSIPGNEGAPDEIIRKAVFANTLGSLIL